MILVIDDDREILAMLADMLKLVGYDVETAEDGYHALKLFKAQPDRYELVVTDIGLPGLSGLAVAQQVLTFHPKQPLIFITGYVVHEDFDAIGKLNCPIVRKPFSAGELIRTVQDTLSSAPSPKEQS